MQLMADKSFDATDWEDGDRVTAEEFLNPHAEKGHWPADELNLRMDGGDPVIVDPQSDEVIMRWDRGESEWVFDSIRSTAVSTECVDIDSSIYSASSGSDLESIQSDANEVRLLGPVESDITLTDDIVVRGVNWSNANSGSYIDATVDLDGSIALLNLRMFGASEFNINEQRCTIQQSFGTTATEITVNADDFIYVGNYRGSITFEEGTSGGVVDGCSDTEVTDGGDNLEGDIA